MHFEDAQKLIKSIVKRVDFRTNNILLSTQDLEQEGWLAYLKARNNYDPTKKVKFLTYAYKYIYFELLKYIKRKNSNKQEELNLDDLLVYPSGLTENKEELYATLNKFNSIDRIILCDYFINHLTYREISSKLGMSESTIYRHINAILEKAKDEKY